MKAQDPTPSTRMVGRQFDDQQRCRIGRPAGVIEAAPRFNGAREILVKAIIFINLTALTCVTVGRGHTYSTVRTTIPRDNFFLLNFRS